MEVMLKSDTVVTESRRRFNIPEVDFEEEVPEEVQFQNIQKKCPSQSDHNGKGSQGK